MSPRPAVALRFSGLGGSGARAALRLAQPRTYRRTPDKARRACAVESLDSSLTQPRVRLYFVRSELGQRAVRLPLATIGPGTVLPTQTD